jgi:hypothetical protein
MVPPKDPIDVGGHTKRKLEKKQLLFAIIF